MADPHMLTRCVIAGAVCLAASGAGTAAASFAADDAVTVVRTPRLDRPAVLNAVSFSSPGNGWTVGSIGESLAESGLDILIERRGAGKWMVTPTAEVGVSDEVLTGVFASDAHNAWAVGWQDRYGYQEDLPVLLHWDGLQWSPQDAELPGIPTAIAGSGPDDIWAVGPATFQHFDGTAWRAATAPDTSAVLNGVTVLSPSNAWAVGQLPDSRPGYGRLAHPYVAHWDGTAWTTIKVPQPTSDARLAAVSASSAADVWAVGRAAATTEEVGGTFVLHFDGLQWSRVKSQNRGADNGLTSVVASSPTEVWAVGHRDGFNHAGNAVWRTLVERWDGNEWSVVDSPNDSPNDNHLTGVAVGGPRKVWAVGGDGGTLVERIRR